MSLPQAFEPSALELGALSPQAAVDALRDLLVAEARRFGLALTGVNVPASITTRDGGVDATVEAPAANLRSSGLLQKGLTSYQVKTGSFSGSSIADAKTILLKPSSWEKRRLKPEDLNDQVKFCLDKKGTLVVVLFGSEAVERKPGAALEAIRTVLNRVGTKYKSSKIKILRVNQLTKLFGHAPSTALAIKRISGIEHVAHSHAWMEKKCGFAPGPYISPPSHLAVLEQLRAKARDKGKGFRHVRLVGEPGGGKTRLIFEAMASSDIAPLVVYVDDAARMIAGTAFEWIAQLADVTSLVLIADECDQASKRKLQQRFGQSSIDTLLVTIHNEEREGDREDSKLYFLEAPRLAKAEISKILAQYKVESGQAGVVAELCDGSPRVAHEVGRSIAERPPGSALALSSLNEIWDAYVAGRDGVDGPLYPIRHLVLSSISLFKKCGWQGEFSVEAKFVYDEIVAKIDPGISFADFRHAVEYFQKRRVLQGRSTLYISPRLLHIKLWSDWWTKYSAAIDFPGLLERLPGKMRDWVFEMFVYAKESRAAMEVVNKLLAAGGPFSNLSTLSKDSSASLLFRLAQVNPKAAVRRILEALEKCDVQSIKEFKEGRREVIRALEHIALFEECFLDAAKSLLVLAEGENESWSNNASGVFADLFTLGYGKLASTQLHPEERLPFLLELLQDNSNARRELAVSAFSRALETNGSRSSLGDAHGLTPIPDGWTPATYGEWWAEYERYLQALFDAGAELPAEWRRKIYEVILQNDRGLMMFPSVAPKLLNILSEIARGELHDEVVASLVTILHFDRSAFPAEFLNKIQRLYDELVGVDFDGKLRRFVAMDLLEDKFDENGEHRNEASNSISPLAAEAIEKPELLESHYRWLLTDEAKQGYLFGRLLAERDLQLKLWPRIRTMWSQLGRKSNLTIAGYLSGLAARDTRRWENELNLLAEEFPVDFPGLLWRSGMSESMAVLLLNMAKGRLIDLKTIRQFIYGSAIDRIPDYVVLEFLELLCERGERNDAEAALQVISSLTRRMGKIEDQFQRVSFKVLVLPALFEPSTRRDNDVMSDFYWLSVAKRLMNVDPLQALNVGLFVIDRFGINGTIFGSYRPQSLEFLDSVVEKFPEEMWGAISSHIDQPLTERGLDLLQWLRGDERSGQKRIQPVFEKLPRNSILSWIGKSAKTRASVVAHFAPPPRDENFRKSLAYQVIAKWGHIREVRSALHANFATGSWWGPASSHHTGQRSLLEAIQENETNKNVKRWLHEAIDHLSHSIDIESAREERDDF